MEGDGVQAKGSNGKQKKVCCKTKRARGADSVLRTLLEIPDSQKLGTLAVKYAELDELHKKCESSHIALEKQCTVLQKEKDQLKNENGKQLLARNHLEELCRELYRLNKMVKEDSVVHLREEEERRKEVTSKFESTLNEVTNMMQENSLKNDKLRDDNLCMAKKMKVLYEEFENRKEEQVRLDQQLDLERQLMQVQIEKAKLEMQAERVLWDEERTSLIEKWKQSENSCAELQFIVEDLRKRMEAYEERHHGYKSAIDNNSKFFETCKTEIKSMNKKVTLLEKEIIMWKERSQQNALKAMDISLVKQAQDVELATALKRVESLQSLCRQLQDDRSSYLKILHARGIDPSCQVDLEMQVLQKEKWLKPVRDQLGLVKLECLTKKDQVTLDALENVMDYSKSRDAIHSAVTLTLGFINFKLAIKKGTYFSNFDQTPFSCVANSNCGSLDVSDSNSCDEVPDII